MARVVVLSGDRGTQKGIPEIDRLLLGIQYAFADTVKLFLVDQRVRNVLAFAGIVGLKPLTSKMRNADGSQTAVSVWTSGIAMAWVNLVVGIIIPDGRWSVAVYVEAVTAMSMAVLLQALSGALSGLVSLQGYVEWHLSNVFARGMQSAGIDQLDVMIASGTILAVLYVAKVVMARRHAETAEKTSAVDTLVNIATLMVVNTTARALMDYIRNRAVVDSLSVIAATIVLAKAFVHIFSVMAKAGVFAMYF